MTTIKQLDNGLTLLLEANPQAQTVAAGYFIGTGARDESSHEMGASHFLEHLMFKGSERVDARILNQRLDDLGGYSNAFTTHESTVYHAATLAGKAPELLDVLTELMRPALRLEDIEPERKVILEEMAMYAEQPSSRLDDLLRKRYWKEHPLAHHILGTPQTVNAMNREMLHRHFTERYGAERVTLVVVGAFDELQVLEWADQELTGWMKSSPLQCNKSAVISSTPQTTYLEHDAHLNRVHVALSLPGLSVTHPLREAAVLLANLIGEENSALYWALVDSGLTDSADFYHASYRDVGVFEGGFICNPERMQQVLATFCGVLNKASSLINETVVRRAGRKAAVSILEDGETTNGRMFLLGMKYVATGQVKTTEELAQLYTQITPEQLHEVLRLRPLQPSVVVGLGPIEREVCL